MILYTKYFRFWKIETKESDYKEVVDIVTARMGTVSYL